jgi:hypothetical protein
VRLSAILFLFLSHLSIGIVWTLGLVSREAGVKFFRFNAGLALILLVAGLMLRPAGTPADALMTRVALAALLVMAALLFVYWVIVGRALSRWRPWLARGAGAAGLAAVWAQGGEAAAGAGQVWQTLTAASFATSAALLGGACTAMILGHWYLVLPSMQVHHLQRIVGFHIGSLVLRVAVVGLAVLLALYGHQPGGIDFSRYVLSVEGIFFWQRVFFGLAAPALLAYLTWETAKIRSTQSATGILYVDFFTVIVGELLAKYLLLATAVPL